MKILTSKLRQISINVSIMMPCLEPNKTPYLFARITSGGFLFIIVEILHTPKITKFMGTMHICVLKEWIRNRIRRRMYT